VIGPLPETRFRRGFARLRPGELLVLCTDGILERRAASGEFFDVDRLRATVRETQDQSAAAIVERIFDASSRWATAALGG